MILSKKIKIENFVMCNILWISVRAHGPQKNASRAAGREPLINALVIYRFTF